MPNFDKDPGGYNMKPSGFKMKNPTLSAGRKGAPIQANYGGGDESPAKFLGGILRGVNSITRVVDKGARGVRRKVRGTVGKVAKRAGFGRIAGKLGVGRKRGSSTGSSRRSAPGTKLMDKSNTIMNLVGKGLVKNKSVKKNPTRGLTHKSTIKVGNRPIGRPNLSGKGGFGVGAAAASVLGSRTPRKRPATGSQASRANKRRALFSGGLFGKK